MQVTLTNLGTVSLPLTSSEGDGLAVSLSPGVPYVLDDERVTVATVGENASFAEDLAESLSAIAKKARELLTFWREHRPQPKDAGDATAVVHVRIVASESNSIRVTSDNKENDYEVTPGATYDAQAPDYVELRQLGV